MGNKLRISVTLGLVGIGLILGNWAYSKMPLEGFTKGRVYMVLGLYGVALGIGLWKMYKPRGVRLPEFKEDNLSMDLPDDPVGVGLTWIGRKGSISGQPNPDELARARQFLNLEEITDYKKAAERYNQSRKQKKADH